MRRINKTWKQLLCFLIVCCMIFPDVSTAAVLSGDESGDQALDQTAGFSFEAADCSVSEGDESTEITITRAGESMEAGSVTVSAYDFSAEYGLDYELVQDEKPVEKIEDSVSVYQSLKEDGLTVDTNDLSEAMNTFQGNLDGTDDLDAESLEGVDADAEATAEDASQKMTDILDQAGAKSAEMTIDFEEGQTSAVFTVNSIDDEDPEYEEYFILNLASDSGLGENWTMMGCISDNEESELTNTVSFSEKSVAVDTETDTAELWFERTGDLEVFSTVVLTKDEEAYGYINFNPYQKKQKANVPAGTYQMLYPVNCEVTEDTAVVSGDSKENTSAGNGSDQNTGEATDEASKENSGANVQSADVAEKTTKDTTKGAAKETTDGVTEEKGLDKVPNYSAIPNSLGGSSKASVKTNADWISDWATASNETEDARIVVGGNTLLFKEGGHDGHGEAKYVDNYYELDTSGTGSRWSTGYIYIDGITSEDMTGIGSVTGCYTVENLDHNAEVKLGVYKTDSKTLTVDRNSSGEITCTLPDYFQESRYVYYQNVDPTNDDDGCQVLTLNGYKLNKREYYVTIETPDALPYTDGNHAATIDGNNARMYKKIGDGKSAKSKISIVYNSPEHPQTLVGYKLVNKKTNKTSELIKMNSSENITFDKAFLKKYEKDYFYKALDEAGKEYETVTIKPVMEKIAVDSYSLEDSALGSIKLTNADANNKLYQGDIAVFEADNSAEGVTLSGVYVKARSGSNTEWIRGTKYADSDKTVKVPLNPKYDDYVFQGVYSTDADILSIEYAQGAKDRGTLTGSEGIVVKKSEYVINDFYPLMAQPKDGYVTKWESNGRTYYGDIFYYQLDGNPDNNRFTVDFVKASLETANIKGTMSVTDVNLHNSALSSSHPLEYKDFSVTSVENYTGQSEKDGIFHINNFKGVKGGTYSMAVLYGDIYCYETFTFGDAKTYDFKIPQFGPGVFFPASVEVSLDGAGSSENKIQLREESYVETTVWVYNQVNSPYTIKDVELKYYGEDENGKLTNLVKTKTITDAAGKDGNYTKYVSKVSAADLTQNTRLYAEVVGSRTMDVNGQSNTVEVRSGEINCGYEFISPIKDTSIPVQESVPNLPGAQSALTVDLQDLDIPFIGSLDFGVNSKAGAFFIHQPDVNDPSVYYLVAGYSVNSVWGVGSPQDKFNAATQTIAKLDQAKEETTPKGDMSKQQQQVTSKPTNKAGQTKAGEEKQPSLEEQYGLNTTLGIYPLGMLKFAFKTTMDANKQTKTKLSLYEIVLGIDSHFMINKPFMVYGIPLYVSTYVNGEQFVQMQQNVNVEKSSLEAGDDFSQAVMDATPDDRFNCFYSMPQLQLGLKGGAGVNNLAGAYLEGTVDSKLKVEVAPDIDAGGSLAFDLSVGADVLVLNAKLTLDFPEIIFGDRTIYNEIAMFSSKSSAKQKEMLDEAAANATFSLMKRPNAGALLKASKVTSSTLESQAFKKTKVKMIPLGNGSIMAVLLTDNGAGEGSANFVSVAYTISTDNGSSWGKVQKIDNSDFLQFGFETYELNDKLLITWSEGDLDTRLKDLDKNNVSAAQAAQALNEMNLKGCYFDKNTGAALGDSFIIAKNTGVAMSAMGAVQAEDGTVSVYYSRTSYPTEEGTTLEDLLEQERTIACATGDVTDNTKWNSESVTAQDNSGSNYRITEIQPFSHDGITGEILVLDRDGKLAVKNESSGDLEPSVEDRQIYMRIRSSADNKANTLIPLTEAGSCAQNVQMVSDQKNIYLFWNQDGHIVYLQNFVVNAAAGEAAKASAVAVVNQTTNEVTKVEQEDGLGGSLVAVGAGLKVQSKYSVSMSDSSDILLSWIEEESEIESDETKLYANDEIYGIILKPETVDGNSRLHAVGNPVALTDEKQALGTLDSVCLSDSDFLLGYSKMNGETMLQSDSASICMQKVAYQPKLTITDVIAPSYPMPGSEMSVQVTVRNDGIATLHGASVKASGLGSGGQGETSDDIDPGCEETVSLTVNVPEDFNQNTKMQITASGLSEQSSYTAEKDVSVLYGSYFVPQEMAKLSSIPDTKEYVSELTVTNMGNAVGTPKVSYLTYLAGSEEEDNQKKDSYQSEEKVAPGESTMVTYTLEDTIGTKEDQSQMQIILGDGYDQSVEGVVPAARVSKEDLGAPSEKVDCKNHVYKEVVTPASPDKDGKIESVCTICGKVGKTTVIARPANITLSKTSYTYNGVNKTPSVTVKDRDGKVIPASNYKVTYPSSRAKAGSYSVRITFDGKKYTGQMSAQYTIKPKGTTITRLQAQKAGFKVFWKKQVTQTTGYEIQYSTSKKYKGSSVKIVAVNKDTKTSKIIKNLKKNKKYYVRIRTVKKNGKGVVTARSKWSSTKNVMTKK